MVTRILIQSITPKIIRDGVIEDLNMKANATEFINFMHHQILLMDVTEEFNYSYQFLKKENILSTDYFLNNLYQTNEPYSEIRIECIKDRYNILTKGLSNLICDYIFKKFDKSVFLFFNESEKPELIHLKNG